VESFEAARAPDIEETDGNAASPRFSWRRAAPWGILTAVCFGLYFNGMGSFAFSDPGETYYTEAAREMVESNQWIVPHLNYQVYFSKPILTFWAIAASYKVFGASEWAGRLPFALIATLITFVTYACGKRLYDRRVGFLAALISAAVPLTVVFCKTSPIDLLFCAFLNLAAFAFAMAVFAGEKAWAPVLWAALALAIVTKGPAGLVFFAIGTGLFLLLQMPTWTTLKRWIGATRPLIGVPLFLLLALPWYAAVWRATKGLYLQVFFIYENLARLAGKTNIHKSNLIFVLPVIAYGFAPWSLILPQTIKLTFWTPLVERWFGAGKLNFKSTYRPHMPAPVEGEKSKQDGAIKLTAAEVSSLSSFYLASWSLAIFVFFSLSKTQLTTYIEPILTPLAMLTAATIVQLVDSQNPHRKTSEIEKPQDGERAKKLADKLIYDYKWLRVFTIVAFVLTSVAAVALTACSVWPYLPIYPVQRLALFLTALAAYAGSFMQIKWWRKNEIVATLTAHAVTVCAITAGVAPVVFQVWSKFSEDNMIALARQLQNSPDEIALFGTYMPGAVYYTQRPVDFLSEPGQFVLNNAPLPDDKLSYGPTQSGRKQLILGDDKHMARFKERPDLHLKKIAEAHDWGLYELTNGYAEKPRRLEDTFRYLLFAKHSFMDTDAYGPLTVPLGSGNKDWYKGKKAQQNQP
jgi:4-amino-4-deoxy-L-arabinose transferase-like glycosyltransferase